MEDIRQFQHRTGVARTVMIWCGSTGCSISAADVHQSHQALRVWAARENDPEIAPSQI